MLLPPSQLCPFVVPFNVHGETESNPVPMSEDYRASLEANLNYVGRLQQDVDASGASEEDKAAFQASLERRFMVGWGGSSLLNLPLQCHARLGNCHARPCASTDAFPASTQDWLAKNKRMREVCCCSATIRRWLAPPLTRLCIASPPPPMLDSRPGHAGPRVVRATELCQHHQL